MIRLRCTGCQKQFRMDAQAAGRNLKCPACGRPLSILKPIEDAASPEPPETNPASDRPQEPALTPFWTPATLACLGVFLGLALIAFIFGNLVTRLFVALIVLTTLNGCWMGASNVAAAILGMLAAMLLAVPLGKAGEGLCSTVFGLTGLTNRLLSIGVAGLILMIGVGTVLSILIRRVVKKKPTWRRFDKLLGGGLGMVEGMMLGVLAIWAILAVQPILARNLALAAQPDSGVQPSRAARFLVATADVAQESTLGRVVGYSNPLKEMRVITLLGNAQSVLSDEQSREAFMNHPAMQEIRERPAVQQALELLAEELEPEKLEDGLSTRELAELLRSPRTLEILDETNLLAELSPIAGQIEEALQAALPSSP